VSSTPIRIYVAAPWAKWREARAMMDAIEAAGHIVAHDWTVDAANGLPGVPTGEAATKAATDDLRGVALAHAMILLTFDDAPGSGCWVEVGYALGRGIPVVVVGPTDRNVFVAGLTTAIIPAFGTDMAVRYAADAGADYVRLMSARVVLSLAGIPLL